jgi:hypothetical protein
MQLQLTTIYDRDRNYKYARQLHYNYNLAMAPVAVDVMISRRLALARAADRRKSQYK